MKTGRSLRILVGNFQDYTVKKCHPTVDKKKPPYILDWSLSMSLRQRMRCNKSWSTTLCWYIGWIWWWIVGPGRRWRIITYRLVLRLKQSKTWWNVWGICRTGKYRTRRWMSNLNYFWRRYLLLRDYLLTGRLAHCSQHDTVYLQILSRWTVRSIPRPAWLEACQYQHQLMLLPGHSAHHIWSWWAHSFFSPISEWTLSWSDRNGNRQFWVHHLRVYWVS